MIHIGIVGGGSISETHARAASEIAGLAIAAFHGDNRQRTASLASAYGAASYEDFERFLDHRPLDLVVIGSPSGRHAEQGIAAAGRGLHVLVEKPIDISTGKADALIAADAAGVRLGVCFQDRLHPDVVQIKSMIDDNEIGTPVMISGHVKWHRPAEYYSASRWRGTRALDGGGALMNQAIHTVDLIQWLFGPPTRVYGTTATRVHDIEVEDTAAAVLEFKNGAIGTIEAATSVFPGYARRVEISGSEGTLILEHDRLERMDLRSARGDPPAVARDAYSSGAPPHTPARSLAGTPAPRAAPSQARRARLASSATSPVVSDAGAHRRILEDFIRAIETGGRPACDGREGRKSVAIVEAIYRSARSGQAVVMGE